MVLFSEKTEPGSYEIKKEGEENVMYINYRNYPYFPSIEGSATCMAQVIDFLVENPSVHRIIFSQDRNYEYDYSQIKMLIEIANIYKHVIKQKKLLNLSVLGLDLETTRYFMPRHSTIQNIILNLLRADPLGAYVELKRIKREENIHLKKTNLPIIEKSIKIYLNLIEYILNMLDKTTLIELAKPYLAGYSLGDRTLYRSFFHPVITPDFIYTKLMADHPLDGELIDSYSINDVDIAVFSRPGDIKILYHVTPPEFKIDEDRYSLLDLARLVLVEHEPKAEEFTDPEKMRDTFFNIGRDLLQELAENKNIILPYKDIKELAKILVRYTVGFGLIEVLLKDEKIQDVVINSPIGETPIFVVHAEYGECVTNIVPSVQDGESWASKFRIMSGRPLDEANPVLDTELILPGSRARVAIIGKPLNPYGVAYAFRRHREKPWTFPLFIKNKMINYLAAGLLSFLIDGGRSILIAGTRSSGKSSLLGSVMVEIMRKYRIISLEDTLELPVRSLRKLGFNIQAMKVRSALTKGGTEIAADEGIRTSLRMGDSSLIVGEIRSLEALALYEAMRIGALANVVAGTIHGASPYAVFDRVVNDLKVPRTSFKATDIIVIANPIKSPDGLHSWKRVLEIVEVRKHWEKDPLREKGFVTLMKYNSKTDQLEPTADLINGDSDVLKDIAGNIKEWAGNWDAVWGNILLRSKIKETLVEFSDKNNLPDLLEAEFVILCNDAYHKIAESVKEDVGYLDSKRIFFEWKDWLKNELNKKRLE